MKQKQETIEALNGLLDAAHPAYIQDEHFRNKLIKARDKAFKALEKDRLDQKEKVSGASMPAIKDSLTVESTPAALRYAAKVIELYDDATMRADYMLSSTDCAEILEALAEYFTVHPRTLVDKTPETQGFQVDETDKMQGSLVNKPFTACTCPSGDGSLRWPCPVHPPESVNLMKWSNQQASSTDKKHGFTECVFIGDPPSGYESWAQWGATPIKKGVQIMALTKCDHSYPDNAHESEKKVQP